MMHEDLPMLDYLVAACRACGWSSEEHYTREQEAAINAAQRDHLRQCRERQTWLRYQRPWRQAAMNARLRDL